MGSSDIASVVAAARNDVRQGDNLETGDMSNIFLGSGLDTPTSHQSSIETNETRRNNDLSHESDPPSKRRKTGGPIWSLLEPIWPAAERPATLQDPDFIEQQTITGLMKLHSAYAKKEKQETGQAISRASRDTKPAKIYIEGGEDDCDKVFTAGRWLRPPISKPSVWYQYVPVKYNTIYKSLSYKHMLGMDCAVAPQVTSARHDRRNALQLKHFIKSNANITSKPIREVKSRDADGVSTISDFDWVLPNSVKQCQDGLINFGAVNHLLWPLDPTNISLTRVFNRFDWCIAAGMDTNRVKMIQSVFNR